eukprot:5329326-Amphidinium_carterae.2
MDTEARERETDIPGLCLMSVPDSYKTELQRVADDIVTWKIISDTAGGWMDQCASRCDALVPWHVDIKNDGYTVTYTDLIAFGSYKGGTVQQKSLDERLREQRNIYDVHETWLRFSGLLEHRVLKVKGHRKSVALYCPSGVHHVKREHWLQMRQSGFPVHEFWSHRKPSIQQGGEYRPSLSAFHSVQSQDGDEASDPGRISVTEAEVLRTTGQEWKNWIAVASKEFGAITSQALQPVSDEEWQDIDRVIKQQRVEVVKSMFVWTIKAPHHKEKARIVLLGHLVNQFAAVSVAELDTHLLWLILAWGVYHDAVLSVLDVTTAFLNAPLTKGRKILVHLPIKTLKAMSLVQDDRPFWCSRAMYGLKESPKDWANHRDDAFRRLKIRCDSYTVMFKQSEISRSLWLIVRIDVPIEAKELDESGETDLFLFISPKFPKGAVLGIIGVYVDDLIILCKHRPLSDAVHTALQVEWKTSAPEILGRELTEVGCLGSRVHAMKGGGLAFNQGPYTQDLLRRYAGQYPMRTRQTAAEPKTYSEKTRDTARTQPLRNSKTHKRS